MARTHMPSPSEIILSRATLAGYEAPELLRKTGMKRSTFYRRLSRNDWTLLELLRIDRYIHLTGEDAAGLREWFNGGITKGP